MMSARVKSRDRAAVIQSESSVPRRSLVRLSFMSMTAEFLSASSVGRLLLTGVRSLQINQGLNGTLHPKCVSGMFHIVLKM